MSLVNIRKPQNANLNASVFDQGFRPFFLGGAIYSALAMMLWSAVYAGWLTISHLPVFHWHAHEMIYGYSMAVIAGFLLTAVTDWTGHETVKVNNLKMLFVLWLSARLLFSSGQAVFLIAALTDMSFNVLLFLYVLRPIVKAGDHRQTGILAKVFLLTVGNAFFYAGAIGDDPLKAQLGIYGGLYLIIGLILTIGSRVIPSFIQNAVEEDLKLRNPKSAANLSLVVFLVFFLNYLFLQDEFTQQVSSALLFLITSYRLYLWYSAVIWSRPLLWSLYVSVVFIAGGFFLIFLSSFLAISPYLPLHAFASGGIGFATTGMMARVIIGHSGGNVRYPPRGTQYIFLILLLSTIARVILPAFMHTNYATLILSAQILWTAAFLSFLLAYGPWLFGKGQTKP